MKNNIVKIIFASIFTTTIIPMFCMDTVIESPIIQQITHQEYANILPLYHETLALIDIAKQKTGILENSETSTLQPLIDLYNHLEENAREAKVFFEYARDCYSAQLSNKNIFVAVEKELCITGFLDHKAKAIQYLQTARQIATHLNITIEPNNQAPVSSIASATPVAIDDNQEEVIAPVELAQQTAVAILHSSIASRAKAAILGKKNLIKTASKIFIATYKVCKAINYYTKHPKLLLTLTALSVAANQIG